MNRECEHICEEKKWSETELPSTLAEIDLLIKSGVDRSPVELKKIKTALELMLNSSSWIVFHLVTDAVKKLNSILENKSASPEKSFEAVRGIISYLNDFYSIDNRSGECLVKPESGQRRDIKKFKFWSSLFI